MYVQDQISPYLSHVIYLPASRYRGAHSKKRTVGITVRQGCLPHVNRRPLVHIRARVYRHLALLGIGAGSRRERGWLVVIGTIDHDVGFFVNEEPVVVRSAKQSTANDVAHQSGDNAW